MARAMGPKLRASGAPRGVGHPTPRRKLDLTAGKIAWKSSRGQSPRAAADVAEKCGRKVSGRAVAEGPFAVPGRRIALRKCFVFNKISRRRRPLGNPAGLAFVEYRDQPHNLTISAAERLPFGPPPLAKTREAAANRLLE